MLGSHVSKVRSLALDTWDDNLIQFMKAMGNEKINMLFEATLAVDRKIPPDVSMKDREQFILAKYTECKFFPASAKSKEELSAELFAKVADKKCELPELLKLLFQGADVNYVKLSPEGSSSVLHNAILSGNALITELLVQNGAEVNWVNSKGRTALHLAMQCKDLEQGKVLLRAKAAEDITDEKGLTALDIATASLSKTYTSLHDLLSEMPKSAAAVVARGGSRIMTLPRIKPAASSIPTAASVTTPAPASPAAPAPSTEPRP